MIGGLLTAHSRRPYLPGAHTPVASVDLEMLDADVCLALGQPILGSVADAVILRLDGPERGAVVCRVPFAE